MISLKISNSMAQNPTDRAWQVLECALIWMHRTGREQQASSMNALHAGLPFSGPTSLTGRLPAVLLEVTSLA